MQKFKNISALMLVLVLSGSGCVSVSGLQNDPQRYVGKKIFLFGQVKSVVPVPFTELYVYVFGNDDDDVVVISDKKRDKDTQTFVNGKVIGLAADRASRASEEAVESLADFLVRHNFATPEDAGRIAGNVISVIRTAVSKLGQLFFILE